MNAAGAANTKTIPSLHFLTQDIRGLSPARQAELACKGGVRWVQLRMKHASTSEWLRTALKTMEICRRYGAQLIINDSPAIALEAGAGGVHLGRNDMYPAQARQILGPDAVIGCTVNTFEDIRRLSEANPDYFGLGPFRSTQTKEKLSPVLGAGGTKEVIARARQSGISIPIILIGGIRAEDLKAVAGTGADGVAVSGAIAAVENIEGAAEMFCRKTGEYWVPGISPYG